MKKRSKLRTLLSRIYRAILPALPSSLVVRIYFFKKTGGFIFRLKKPVSFSEKIQWRKVYEHDPRMPALTDKIEAKKIVAAQLGSEWIIPTFYEGSALPPLADRNWKLPYVIKPSHRSGNVVFVRGQDDIRWSSIEAACAEWTADRYGFYNKEWAYSQIEPRILVEEYIGGDDTPIDYKFFCFGGRIEFIQVDTDRQTGHKRVFFDRDWRRQDFTWAYPMETREISRPACLADMIEGVEKLASGWSFVRVDLYEVAGQPKFGEMTFYPASGADRFDPPEWDRVFGHLWRM